MARIRSVHPAQFTDEAWVSCSAMARLLFIGLWTDADDRGVFEWRPLQIKMRLLPADHIDIGGLLDELADAGLLRRFEDGASYGAIKDFQKYQRPQKPRAQYPLPDELVPFVTGISDTQRDLFGGNSATARVESNQMERRGEEKEGRGRGRPRGAADTPIPDGFPDAEAIDGAAAAFSEAGVEASAQREAAKFRDHALSKGRLYKDWRAAFRTWTRNAIDYAVRDGKVVQLADHAPDPEFQNRVWRTWMEDWIAKPYQWRIHERGPTPDQPGCKIPPAIIAEFGVVPPQRGAR